MRHSVSLDRRGPLRERVEQLMPELKANLAGLVRIPSIAFPGFPEAPLHEAHDRVVKLLRDAGVQAIETLSLPDTAPVVTGEIPPPDGAPTVPLYTHYDVQPSCDERAWRTPPFEPTERDGAIYGRGAADDKAGVKRSPRQRSLRR